MQQLRAEDYRTLNAAKEKGEALSASEMERLGGYERERARALEAEERRIQGVVDAIRADAAAVTGEAIARERSEAAAQAAALRPAVARGTMPDSLGAIEALKAERTLRGIESLLGTDPRVLEGIVEGARPRTLRDETTRTMEEWAAADPTGLGVMLTDDLLFRDRVTHSESEAKGMFIGAVGAATVVAPEVMVPVLGRMAIGGLSGKASHEAYVQLGVPSGDAAALSTAIEVALSGHVPAGGEVAKGIAVSRAATTVEAEGTGILSQLRELGQYRVDPLAMGSGIPRLVKKGTVAERVAAIEGRVSVGDATLRPENVATHQLHLRELRAADIETRVEALLERPGKIIAGPDMPDKVWDIERIVRTYGGSASDWVKKSSSHSIEGIQLHYLENIKTGQKVEIKHMIEGYLSKLRKTQ